MLGDDSRDPTYIQTLHRRGYRFIGTVRPQGLEDEISGGSRIAVDGDASQEGDTSAAARASGAGTLDAVSADAGSRPPAAAAHGEMAPGTVLGGYEILSTLGAGASGVVYRARDASLAREVAIKILHPAYPDDPERGTRLEREARLVAGVSHPNIAAIHSLDEVEGTKFAVLEMVDGQTLAERLQAGRLGVEQALEIGRQIASALEAAHDRGIIHRDLKPANIKLTPAGQAKVLDFGLAQALQVSIFGGDADASPTSSLTIQGTGRGSIVGTVAYMSPEQARGHDVDRQADIWSFGCVLYELLSGRRAFAGETVTDTLAAVVEREPDWEALPSETPFLATALLRRCLQKDPDRRLHAIADARIEIEEALASGPGAEPRERHGDAAGDTGHDAGPRTSRLAFPWMAAALAVGTFLGAVGLWATISPAPAPAPVTRFLIGVEPGLRLSGGHAREFEPRSFQRPSRSAMALSPDGAYLVYLATNDVGRTADNDPRQLYRYVMNQGHTTPIEGTEGASDPFFSPDGQWIGFVADGLLKKVPIGGGDPITVFSLVPWPIASQPNLPEVYGASWGDDGTIVVAGDKGGLLAGPATGGTLQPLTTLDADRGETSHRLPHFLPGSKEVLFTVIMTRGDWERAEITVQSLETGERTALLVGGSDARYVPTGHLLFARGGVLMAVGFDADRLEILGEPVAIIDDVLHAIDHGQGFLDIGTAHVAVSDTGTLVYATGGPNPEVLMSLLRVDRNGEPRPLPLPAHRYYSVRLSPDGKQLAYAQGSARELDIWTYDIERDVPRRLTTTGHADQNPAWSPDGKWIAFGSNRDGSVLNLYVQAVDGGGVAQRLTTSDLDQYITSWSIDGVIAFQENDDIWLLPDPLDPASKPRLFFESEFSEWGPTFSPDGKWIAYTSDESGKREVFVRPYPGPDPPTPITGGGKWPANDLAWARDGSELYFLRRGVMTVVELGHGSTLEPGVPRELFRQQYSSVGNMRAYDVDADGGFLMISLPVPNPQPVTQLNVVLNWFEELKERVPTGR